MSDNYFHYIRDPLKIVRDCLSSSIWHQNNTLGSPFPYKAYDMLYYSIVIYSSLSTLRRIWNRSALIECALMDNTKLASCSAKNTRSTPIAIYSTCIVIYLILHAATRVPLNFPVNDLVSRYNFLIEPWIWYVIFALYNIKIAKLSSMSIEWCALFASQDQVYTLANKHDQILLESL